MLDTEAPTPTTAIDSLSDKCYETDDSFDDILKIRLVPIISEKEDTQKQGKKTCLKSKSIGIKKIVKKKKGDGKKCIMKVE